MKKALLGLVVVVVAAIAVSLIALPEGAEWTTDSPEALAAFQAAMDAKMKLYHPEARAQLERAVELDPDFVIAKLYLADQVKMGDEDVSDEIRDEVFAADISGLTSRERLIVERARAYREKRYEDGNRMLDDYLAEHPNDPYMLHEKALLTWIRGEFEEAEKLNRRLIDIAPNWVLAYNQLGYIAMSQGRFAEAEEYFTSYRFVAPDQANPHDSLGELYIILGRYDEAETSLLRSIEIRPDFWAAYDHLALVRMRMNDFVGAERALTAARETGDLPDYWDVGIDCMVDIARRVAANQWPEILAALFDESPCRKGHSAGYAQLMAHLAAVRLGERDIAQAIEDDVAKLVAKIQDGSASGEMSDVLGVQAHLRAVRLAVNGDFDGAEESFREADRHLTYIQAGNGLFKLYNRLAMVETLLAAGDEAKAYKVLSKVRSVNPRIVEDFEEKGLKYLGLER
jgi:tetratricopeptide (TPR) repeat protein